MTELTVECDTTNDDSLPISITHQRDVITIDGNIDQDYRFLTYLFSADDGEIEARVYLDDIWEVSIIAPIDLHSLPADVMAYLQKRFRLIKQLGGPDGYRTLWQVSRHLK